MTSARAYLLRSAVCDRALVTENLPVPGFGATPCRPLSWSGHQQGHHDEGGSPNSGSKSGRSLGAAEAGKLTLKKAGTDLPLQVSAIRKSDGEFNPRLPTH
jgi:hypothetical protein